MAPFGSVVIVKPSPTKYRARKPLPIGVFGICWGYRFAPGGPWNGECVVLGLDFFVNVDFHNASPGHGVVMHPQWYEAVKLPKMSEVAYPLKKGCDRVDFALEGAQGRNGATRV